MLRILLLLWIIFIVDSADTILDKLRIELELSKTVEKDPIIPFLCKTLPTREFIDEADEEDLLSSILYELGFGVLGVKSNSWASNFRENQHKPASCYAALHSTATTEITKSTLASSRRILSRCCNADKDL